MDDFGIGTMNGHVIGRILKEAVRRAMVRIRSERATFESHIKQGYTGKMDDVFTSADKGAQEIYLKTFTECFPDCGVIAEEDSFFSEPKNGCSAYFTNDPLDGTRAFIRRQSHGVGTMVALVKDNEVISAYVGDINTNEIYGYRPGASRVWRITDFETFEDLSLTPFSKNGHHILLRDPLEKYSELSQATIHGAFDSYQIDGGSIGIWMARLWKREVSAVLMLPGSETPWDATPVVGISKKLGYVFLKPNDTKTGWIEYDPVLPKNILNRDHDMLVIHRENLSLIKK